MDRVGPTIIGRRNTPGADAARDLLTRNEVPHRWVDLDRDPLVPLLETELLSAGRLPLVVFPDGTQLEGPEDYTELVPGREEGVPRERYLASAHWRAEFAARGSPDNAQQRALRRWWPLARDPLFLESSQPGLFVAGDVRHGSIKRVASAVGEGATSIALVHNYLATLDGDRQ